MTNPSFGPGYFPTTNWSLVVHAGDELDEEQSAALDELLRTYWPALKAHLVFKKRIDPNDADDLVQGFIDNKVLEKNLVSVADQTRGRFRGLLVTALDNYVANQYERGTAKKRAAEHARPIDPHDQQRWTANEARPDQAFDIEWARQLLAEVVRRMQAECRESGRDDLWGVFDGRILAPIRDGAEPLDYEELVHRFQFRSPSQASNALVTAKRMFARVLKDVVSEYAFDEADVEAEIQELERCLSRQT